MLLNVGKLGLADRGHILHHDEGGVAGVSGCDNRGNAAFGRLENNTCHDSFDTAQIEHLVAYLEAVDVVEPHAVLLGDGLTLARALGHLRAARGNRGCQVFVALSLLDFGRKLALDFFERAQPRRFVRGHLHDVISVSASDQLAWSSRLHAECGVLELRFRNLASNHPADVTAFGGCTSVLGILGRKLLKVGALLQLIQQVLRLGFQFGQSASGFP